MSLRPSVDNSATTPNKTALGSTTNPVLQQQMGPVGKEMLVKANELLREYKTGKDMLEKRVKESEQWWKMRHWEEAERQGEPTGNPYDRRPKSAWLFNVIAGKHADAIEAYPEPLILPREQADEEEAQRLTSILPVVLQQNEFDSVYSSNAWTKNISGTGVYGVFWDRSKLNGLGDITVRKVSVLNLFWAPGLTDIQESPHFFHVEKVDNSALEAGYPHLKGKLKSGTTFSLTEFETDDRAKQDHKSIVVDWYYKKRINGKTVLHYCKYVGDNILFATENTPDMAEAGWYADGEYPYVFDALYPVEGSPCGFGYVEIGKSPQLSIDILNQQLLKSAVINATPRAFVGANAKINEQEYADITKPLVHVSGSIDDTTIRDIQSPPPSGAAMQMRQQMIEEMKYTASNMDVVNGGSTSGITAASAIAALQESAGRTSRASTKGTYRAYARITNMIIERIRQFYDMPRQFRILGANGEQQFIQYSAQNLQAQALGSAFGNDMGMRLPVFDIDVRAQKETAYTRLAQNELAIQLYGMGVFNPQMADQATMLLDMMDFKGIEELRQKVQQNNMLYQMMQQMMMAQQAQMAAVPGQAPPQGQPNPQGVQPMAQPGTEDNRMQGARERAQNVSQPGA